MAGFGAAGNGRPAPHAAAARPPQPGHFHLPPALPAAAPAAWPQMLATCRRPDGRRLRRCYCAPAPRHAPAAQAQ
eukprot:scaffold30106_cov197-Isochrysis_galbana.AAC.1